MIEVHFEDSSKKKFPWTEETTVDELLKKVELKMHLKSDLDSFALFDSFVKDGYQYDRILKKEDTVQKPPADRKLLFKKRHFFNENLTDADLVHMEYIQVREDVLRNRYILEEREWLELSAIDLRITYGEPDSEKHKAGFLTSLKLLDRFIPRAYLPLKSADEWEQLLLEEFQRVAFDPIANELEGKVRYITKLKEYCKDYYGSIFYEGNEIVEETVTKDGKTKNVQRRYPSLLAMNMNGIFMFRKDGAAPTTVGSEKSTASKAFSSFKSFLNKATSSAPTASGLTSPLDKYKHVLIRSNPFKEIIGWSSKNETSTFYYSVPGTDPSVPIGYGFESPIFDEMPSACQEIVDLILQQMQKEGGAEEEKSGEETTPTTDGESNKE